MKITLTRTHKTILKQVNRNMRLLAHTVKKPSRSKWYCCVHISISHRALTHKCTWTKKRRRRRKRTSQRANNRNFILFNVIKYHIDISLETTNGGVLLFRSIISIDFSFIVRITINIINDTPKNDLLQALFVYVSFGTLYCDCVSVCERERVRERIHSNDISLNSNENRFFVYSFCYWVLVICSQTIYEHTLHTIHKHNHRHISMQTRSFAIRLALIFPPTLFFSSLFQLITKSLAFVSDQ